ncbi:porin family protein [Solirubrum puertoriconensis]|uniref:Outer membrane protein beta-barrel domain-containing protein n=1 Tax=Solirubrum puertoriconensis TaxID=1751427 RepID=A0A9X0HPH6_SOLP1|nr:porin family protein [Solirubrum puertoriconensis]KUG09837.1 hypothetical protein ASU33_19405 [Solirubrum puertoriconensis]
MQASIKALLLGVCLAGVAASAQAQSSESRFGIRGGLNIATQEQAFGGTKITNENINGFHAGLVAELPLAGGLAVRPEVLFSRKGMEYTISALGQSASYKDRLSYVTVPVSLTYRIEAGPAGLVLGAGPYVGALVHAEREGTARLLGTTLTGTGELNIGDNDDDDYKTVDAGLNFLGLLEIDRVFVGANYGLGLSNVLPSGDDNTYRRNRTWELTLGVYLTK